MVILATSIPLGFVIVSKLHERDAGFKNVAVVVVVLALSELESSNKCQEYESLCCGTSGWGRG